jgi:hypothetical protein
VRSRLGRVRRHRAAQEAVDGALAEDHIAVVSHLHATHAARRSQSTELTQPRPSRLPPGRVRAVAASVGAWAELGLSCSVRCRACSQGEMLSKQALTASWLASFKQSMMGIRSAPHARAQLSRLEPHRERAWRALAVRLEHRHIANSLAHPSRPRMTHHAPAQYTGRSSKRQH